MSCNAKKDPNGTWRIQYRWTDWTGTKKKSQKRGFKTKKEAEEWYAHFMLQQSSDPTMTLADFWEIYKADMEKRLRKTTMKQKEYVMNDKVLPYFGKTPINEITAPMIRKWQGEMMEKGFKPTYLKTIHNQLSAILNYAVNFYDLRSNPCRKAGSMGKSKADERPYWTLEEFQKFSDGRPIEKSISTGVFGVHHCMEKIQKELFKRGGVEVPEMLIEPLLRNGIGERTDDVAMVTKRIAESYTEEIMKKLTAHGYKEDLVHLYIIGGGGRLLRHFSDLTEKRNVTVISDICANAKGYEALAEMKQRVKGKTA